MPAQLLLLGAPPRGGVPAQGSGPGVGSGGAEPAAAAGGPRAAGLRVPVSGGAGAVGAAAGGEPAGVRDGVAAAAAGHGGGPEGLLQHGARHAEGQGRRGAAGGPAAAASSCHATLLRQDPCGRALRGQTLMHAAQRPHGRRPVRADQDVWWFLFMNQRSRKTLFRMKIFCRSAVRKDGGKVGRSRFLFLLKLASVLLEKDEK